MINKREIINFASAQGLHPHVVEKDYVLGWLLWGISNHNSLAKHWLFKGGTCLKKCFFETYRFSEDLDYTLEIDSHIDTNFLKTVFTEISERIYEESGIELPVDLQQFDIYSNPRGNKSCQIKIAYQGPVSPRGKSTPRVKLDLTADERIVLPSVQSTVFHPYSDNPINGITVNTYAYEEVFAEKIRALVERARPRDLYDVITMFNHKSIQPNTAVLLNVLKQKCEFKNIPMPSLYDLDKYKKNLESGWSIMLAHQLPTLPPFETFWDELPAFFLWLNENHQLNI